MPKSLTLRRRCGLWTVISRSHDASWQRLGLIREKSALRTESKGERRTRGKAQGAGREDGLYRTDEVDEQIIAALRKNGRVANRDLARDMGVNEATVRTRLRRLEDANMLRVVAMRDLAAMGFEYLAPVGVQVKGRSVADVGADIAKIERVITVNVAIGTHDLEVQVVAESLDEMQHLLTSVIAKIEGVERLFPSLALRVFKYNPEWAPL
ncbi:Lrp/AsnC family transcriptional regulator [Sphingomonas cavernae]|uniref:Lrp/AsnC family transcriptional regulator n=1 Tax=Sphingomonas cavernae TaxID=2320861 RepID=A0A418WPJ5_9SPHN|nr:Lrp/AsnC family transcriptional regulator [Sphingomonas cavernae]